MVVQPDGEWEAWLLAPWLPGAHRTPSVGHLLRWMAATRFAADDPAFALPLPDGLPTVYEDPPGTPDRRGAVWTLAAPSPLADLAARARSRDRPDPATVRPSPSTSGREGLDTPDPPQRASTQRAPRVAHRRPGRFSGRRVQRALRIERWSAG
jgi:hypothetical protein